MCDIVAKAHKRTAAVYHAFVSHNADVLVCAYITYVCPFVENDSRVWLSYTVKDIDATESVQHRYTKRVSGLKTLSYPEHLQRLNLIRLELRRFHAGLIWCYKILFGHVDMCSDELFEFFLLTLLGATSTSCTKRVLVSMLDVYSLQSVSSIFGTACLTQLTLAV